MGVTKTMNCCLQTDCRAPFARRTDTVHWPWRRPAHGYMKPSSLLCSVFGGGRYSESHQKRKLNLSTQSLTYNLFCFQNMLVQWWHRICGSVQQYLSEPKALSTRKSITDTAWVTKNKRLEVKPSSTLLKKKSIKWLPWYYGMLIGQCLIELSGMLRWKHKGTDTKNHSQTFCRERC